MTEVMREKGNSNFISQLNMVRIGEVDHTVKTLLRSRIVNKNNDTSWFCCYTLPKMNLSEKTSRKNKMK